MPQNMDPDERVVLRSLLDDAASTTPDHDRLGITIARLCRRLDGWTDGSFVARGSRSERTTVCVSLTLLLLISELASLDRKGLARRHSRAQIGDIGRDAEDASAHLASFMYRALPLGFSRTDLHGTS